MDRGFIGRALRALGGLGVAAVLAACGGGAETTCVDGVGGSACRNPSGGSTTTVSRLSIVLTNANGAQVATLNNTSTERLTATVTALDGSNSVVANAPVTFAVTSGEVIPAGNATGDQGKVTAAVGIGDNRASRRVTVTATSNSGSGSITASADFLVIGAKLSASAPVTVSPGQAFQVTYTLEDASSNAMPDQDVSLTTSANATPVVVRTGAAGKATFDVTAPSAVGGLTLTASAAGESLVKVVDVTTNVVAPAVGPVLGASVAANPSVVSVNTSSTANATTVRALFKGNNNAPIERVRVWFTLPDPNSVGGTFGNTGLVYSDATGAATTTYIPGPVSSPTDGVIVRACYSTNDFAIPPAGTTTCPAGTSTVETRLTVVDQALRLSIGTDELIGTGTGTYIKDFVVIVVDAAGRAKADVEITPKLDLARFFKGYYGWDGTAWTRAAPTGVLQTPGCDNEDVNRNGTMEAGEDVNGNGELDPAGVSISMVGSNKTDASGKAIVRIEYPRDRATWIDYLITVTGRVSGSEGAAVYRGELAGLGPLPAPGDAFRDQNVAPAFVISPYGRAPGCNNIN